MNYRTIFIIPFILSFILVFAAAVLDAHAASASLSPSGQFVVLPSRLISSTGAPARLALFAEPPEQIPAIMYVMPYVAIASIVFPVVFLIFICVRGIRRWRQHINLMRFGESAEGKIIKTWETGISVNDCPEIGILVEVYPEGRPEFRAEARKIISILDVMKVQPGNMLRVKFDREDTSKIAVTI